MSSHEDSLSVDEVLGHDEDVGLHDEIESDADGVPAIGQGDGDANGYIRWARSLKPLTAEEESDLINRYQNEGSRAALDKLVTRMQYLVTYQASRYRTVQGLRVEDLIQEGNIGLMKAIERYDFESGNRLAAFAVHWVRSTIGEYVMRNIRSVRIATTRQQRKLMSNTAKVKRATTPEEIEALADELGVRVKDVKMMQYRLNGRELSTEAAVASSDAGGVSDGLTVGDTLSANSYGSIEDLEDAIDRENLLSMIREFVAELGEREAEILRGRWLTEPEDKIILADFAEKFGISTERVRQIEKGMHRKLREFVAERGIPNPFANRHEDGGFQM